MRFRAVSAVVLPAMLVGAFLASSLGRDGLASSQLRLNPGTAWFADEQTGQASLLDGGTVSLVGPPVATGAHPHDHLTVVQAGIQSGAGAYVIDRTTGTVTRIDGATLTADNPINFSSGQDDDLMVASNAQATWAIHQNGSLAVQVNPTTLAPLSPNLPFSSQGGTPVETPNGTLWTSGKGGYIYSFAGGLARTRSHPAAGSYSLVEADNHPVAVDTTTGTAIVLDSGTGRPSRSVAFDPPGPGPFLISGAGSGPYVMSVDPTDAELQVTDLQTGGSSGTEVIGRAGARYGSAVISGDLIFVPSLSQSAVVVARVDHDQLSVLGQIWVDDDSFDLTAANDSVWFDDAADGWAGVITANFEAKIPTTGGRVKVIGTLEQVNSRPPSSGGGGTSVKSGGGSSGGGGASVKGGGGSSGGGGTSAKGVGTTGSGKGTTATITAVPPDPAAGQSVDFSATIPGMDIPTGWSFDWVFPSGSPPTSKADSPDNISWPRAGGPYNVAVTISAGHTTISGDVTIMIGPSLGKNTPIIKGVNPDHGYAAGGNKVTITGSDLAGTTEVSFGTFGDATITANTASSITVTAPKGQRGASTDIRIVTPGGTSQTTPNDLYNYITATAIGVGTYSACALLTGGSVDCWGTGVYGELGDGSDASSTTPVQVTGITNASAMSTDGSTACALISGGTIDCWGQNDFGELGDGNTTNSSTPVQVTGIDNATAISVGNSACAVLSGGTIDCWGENGFGQLGDGNTINSSVPVQVSGINNATAISASGNSACALLSGGDVDCWGYNGSGGLGDGNTTNSNTPVQVTGINNATAISASVDSACALLSGGDVDCWGDNELGGLGNGNTANSSTPVQVTGINNATAISAGWHSTCAILTGGSIDCWGDNDLGELGDGNTTNSSTAVQVSGINNATTVSTFNGSTCALLSSGTVACWGYGSYGVLGDGNTTSSSTPVAVKSPW